MKRAISLLTALILLVSLLALPVGATEEMANHITSARNGVVRFYTIDSKGDSWVGSGFALGEEGTSSDIFATNYHVIDDAVVIYILLDNEWRKSVPERGGKADNVHAVRCDVVYENGAVPDFAIVRAKRVITERVCLPLMHSNLAFAGDTVFALGYPAVADSFTDSLLADIDGMTVTRGTLSRFVTNAANGGVRTIQTDASINGGNSGGPMVTEEGYIIGLNTWGVPNSEGNMNLALVIDYVISKLDELSSNGTLPNFTYTLITERTPGETTPGTEPGTQPDVPVTESVDPLIWGLVALCVVMAGLALYLVFTLKKRIEHTRAMRAATAAKAIQAEPAVPAKQSPPQTDSFTIACVSGQLAGQRFPLQKTLRLGRSPGNDILFPNGVPGVSANHCQIMPGSNCVILKDLGSSNGTYLKNGTRITPNQEYILKNGDIFYAGSKQQCFRVELPGAAPVSTPAMNGSARFMLVAVSGPIAGKKFPVNKDLRIGRNPDSDVMLPSGTPGVSGNHCIVSTRDSGVVVKDVGSSMGTFSGSGSRLPANQKVLLKKGDSFYLGSKNNLFRIE